MAESAYSDAARTKISRHIKKHKKDGMPQDQAVAAAMSEARREGKKVPARKGNKKASSAKRAKKAPGTKRSGTKAKKGKAGRKETKSAAKKRRS